MSVEPQQERPTRRAPTLVALPMILGLLLIVMTLGETDVSSSPLEVSNEGAALLGDGGVEESAEAHDSSLSAPDSGLVSSGGGGDGGGSGEADEEMESPCCFGPPELFELNPLASRILSYRLSQGAVEGEVLLTFDDGPNPRTTPIVLEALAQYGYHAVFFTVGNLYNGRNAKQGSALLRRIADEGHLIGNHTMSHSFLSKRTRQEIREEFQHNQDLIEVITGRRPVLFRPAFGDYPPRLQRRLIAAKSFLLMWTLDSHDSTTRDPVRIAEATIRMLKRYRRGTLLMHDGHLGGAEATAPVLAWLAEQERQGLMRVAEPTEFLSRLVKAGGQIEDPIPGVTFGAGLKRSHRAKSVDEDTVEARARRYRLDRERREREAQKKNN